MKRALLVSLAAAGLLASGSAFAQMTTETTTTTWTVKPEERTVIKDYVVKEKIRPEKIKAEIAIGAAVPARLSEIATPGQGCGTDITKLPVKPGYPTVSFPE